MSRVLALKYRPKRFEDIIGQESVSNIITLSLTNKRLSHAYLFSGLRGSGKTSTARIFAKALLCDSGPTATPCDKCDSCNMANENRHIDIIEMDAASNRGIDDVKDLQEQIKYKPSIARYKIFIIDEVHMLTPQAFNALLKTLEEPPEYVKFILATTDPLKLPATILSRTQHFRFKKIAHKKIVHHLEHILHLEEIQYSVDALDIIARSGGGSLRDTLTLLDQAIIFSKGNIDTNSITDMLGLVDPKMIEDIFQAIFSEDKELIVKYTKELSEYEGEMVINEFIEFLKEKMLDGESRYSMLILDRFFRILSDSKYLLTLNSDSTFVIGLMFLKMLEAMKLKSIDEVITQLESTKTVEKIAIHDKNIEQPSTNQVVHKKLHANPFDELIKKIYDRNYDVGECFKNSIKFISYQDNKLSWESSAKEDCKKLLGNYYSNIKQLVKETYGIETIIDFKLAKPKELSQTSRKESITEHPMVKEIDERFGIESIEVKNNLS